MLVSPRRTDLVSLPRSELASGEVEVAIHGSGVCGSNVPVWLGRPWFDYPLVAGAPGHEGWGEVVDVGPAVTAVRIGDPVALLGDQVFAECAIVPEADAVVLPPALANVPFPGEALGCAFNAAARCDFRRGQSVAVVGVGFLGAVIIALAASTGARVLAITRRPFGLEIATAMGAAETIAMDDHENVLDAVRRHTDGHLCERVVEAVGEQWPLDLASELTAVGGRLIIAGYHQDGPRSVNMQLWNWRGIDVINAHERDAAVVRAGIREAADAVVTGRIDPTPMYTHEFGLERLDHAFDALVERPDGFLKSLVVS